MLFSNDESLRTQIIWNPLESGDAPPEGVEVDEVLNECGNVEREALFKRLFAEGASRLMVIRMRPKAFAADLPGRMVRHMVENGLEYASVRGMYCGSNNQFIEVLTQEAMDEAMSRDSWLLPSFQLNAFGLHGEKSLCPLNDNDVRLLIDGVFIDEAAKYPAGITVDMTTKCNLRCKKCIYHGSEDGLEAPIAQKDIEFDVFSSMVSEISKWSRVPFLTLAMRGEPLLNKDIAKATALLKEHGIPFGVVTNGILLSEEVMNTLSENGIQYLCVSLDTNDPVAYHKAMGVNAFNKVVANVERMLDFAYQNKFPTPMLNFVVSRFNKHEEEAFLKRWEGKCKIVKVGQYQDLTTTRKPESLFFKPNQVVPCPAAWSSMYLFSDGNVRRCCQEGMSSKPLGVFPEQSLESIWSGKEYQDWRSALTERSSVSKRFCQACAGWSKGLNYAVRDKGKLELVSPLVVSHVQPNEVWGETVKQHGSNSTSE